MPPSKASQPSRSDPHRLLPIVAAAFAELGYRRATTAQLARRCGVRENILYRAWPSKKAMFLAAIDYVFESSLHIWQRMLAESPNPAEAPGAILSYESAHQGEFGHYRIVFVALAETEDPDIRAALRRMYLRFQQFIASQVRSTPRSDEPLDPELIGWALVGLGTVSNITRELRLLSAEDRARLLNDVGRLLLQGGRMETGQTQTSPAR
jgi:AcrR family transcriptional regulator